jgi:hypothetical protein
VIDNLEIFKDSSQRRNNGDDEGDGGEGCESHIPPEAASDIHLCQGKRLDLHASGRLRRNELTTES